MDKIIKFSNRENDNNISLLEVKKISKTILKNQKVTNNFKKIFYQSLLSVVLINSQLIKKGSNFSIKLTKNYKNKVEIAEISSPSKYLIQGNFSIFGKIDNDEKHFDEIVFTILNNEGFIEKQGIYFLDGNSIENNVNEFIKNNFGVENALLFLNNSKKALLFSNFIDNNFLNEIKRKKNIQDFLSNNSKYNFLLKINEVSLPPVKGKNYYLEQLKKLDTNSLIELTDNQEEIIEIVEPILNKKYHFTKETIHKIITQRGNDAK